MDIADISSTSIGTSVPSSGVRTEIATAHSRAFVVGGALHPQKSKRENQGTGRKRKRKTNINEGHWCSMTSPTNIRTEKHDHESKPSYNPILTSGQVGRAGLTEEIDINIDMYTSLLQARGFACRV